MNKASATSPQQDYLAALDIGSNSFHFVLARQVEQQLQIVHSEKYRVQLAQGLDNENKLSAKAIKRGIAILESLAISTAQVQPANFRAVATFTLRQAKNATQFLKEASKVFPFDIEIISGHEEARLIYQGVAHNFYSENKRIVIDIGGGSTECIIGTGHNIETLASLTMGCVSYQQQFFSDGKISAKAFEHAINAAKYELDSIVKRFKRAGWQNAVGTSGTIKAIYTLINANQALPQEITLEQLHKLKHQFISFKRVEKINLSELKESRKSVICAGLAVLIAIFERLDINSIDYCTSALREGVLFEQLDQKLHNNIRERSVNSLAERFNVDITHVTQISQLVKTWWTNIEQDWQLHTPIYKELLLAAIKLHELGIDINPSGYHKHGHYILQHADIAGFNQEQQQALAWLVGSQRKKILPIDQHSWYLLSSKTLERLCAVLRLAIIVCQQRQINQSDGISLQVNKHYLTLTVDAQWLQERPIVETELYYEKKSLKKIGLTLTIAH